MAIAGDAFSKNDISVHFKKRILNENSEGIKKSLGIEFSGRLTEEEEREKRVYFREHEILKSGM